MAAHITSLLTSLTWMLGLGLVGSRVARRFGIPDLVLFVLLGLVLGPQVLNLVQLPASGELGQLIVTGGAVFMLYEGGRAIKLDVLRSIWVSTTLLSTVGVVITAAVVALAAHALVGLPWPVSMLAGGAVAATDPATIVPLFAQVRVRPRVEQLVVSESAFNDATSAVVVVTLLAIVEGGRVTPAATIETFLQLIVVGLLAGLFVGGAVQFLVAEDRRFKGIWTQAEENGVATLLAMFAAYTLASALGGSGFMAVFIAGIVRGNGNRWGIGTHPTRENSHDTFLSLLGTAVRMLIFAELGANVDLGLLAQIGLPGLVVTGALLFVARPLTVLSCMSVDKVARWSRREMAFTCWVRETGVVPAALASLLLAVKAPGAQSVAALVFLAVLTTIVVQAPTTAWWARRTGVADGE